MKSTTFANAPFAVCTDVLTENFPGISGQPALTETDPSR